MAEKHDFLSWVRTVLFEAEVALHNGDAGPAAGNLVAE